MVHRKKSVELMCLLILAALSSGLSGGCAHLRNKQEMEIVPSEMARELLPPYVINPPDVLQINAVQLVPRPPYKMKPLDVILVQFPAQPDLLPQEDLQALIKTQKVISGNFTIEPEGTVNLGPGVGKVSVFNMTIEEARAAVEKRLRDVINPTLVDTGKVVVDLVQTRAMQAILGDHLVRPDGSISLGTYGDVIVAGMNIPQAKQVIENHLSQYLLNPEVSVDVSGFNSQVYYVIFDGAGFGEQVIRLPVTGNETVLDAIGQVQGLPSVASRKHIWVARPSRDPCGKGSTLPVDWRGITRKGECLTNYQVLPGDRIYVMAEPLITTNTYLDRMIAPVERVMGFMLLYSATHRAYRNLNSPFGAGGGFGGF